MAERREQDSNWRLLSLVTLGEIEMPVNYQWCQSEEAWGICLPSRSTKRGLLSLPPQRALDHQFPSLLSCFPLGTAIGVSEHFLNIQLYTQGSLVLHENRPQQSGRKRWIPFFPPLKIVTLFEECVDLGLKYSESLELGRGKYSRTLQEGEQ